MISLNFAILAALISTAQPDSFNRGISASPDTVRICNHAVLESQMPSRLPEIILPAIVSTAGQTCPKVLPGFETFMLRIYNAKIYESDTYTSFADLIWYRDRYYCAFRDGRNHVPYSSSRRNGGIRILQSKDCREWNQAAFLTDGKYDMRDPHFCISPKDSSLLMFFAYHEPGNAWVEPSKTAVSVLEQDGDTLSEHSRAGLDAGEYSRWWIWNVSASGDSIYGVGYYQDGSNVALLQSKDGLKWEIVSEIPFPGNESSINIIDGRAYVLMRNSADRLDASMAVAAYPYTSWSVTPMNFGMHSPAGIVYDGKLYICGRKYVDKVRDGVSLFSYDLPSATELNEVYALPCERKTGDNAYPGIIIRDGAMRIVYYSMDKGKNVPDIHYTEIPLDMLEELGL